MLTLEINKNEVERARLVKEAKLWHMLNNFTKVRFQISLYVIIKTCLSVWNCLCSADFATAVSQLSN